MCIGKRQAAPYVKVGRGLKVFWTGKLDRPALLFDLVVRSTTVEFAVRLAILGVHPAEVEVGRERVADWPLAGLLADLQQREPAFDGDEQLGLWHVGIDLPLDLAADGSGDISMHSSTWQ